jgi:nucleoside-diphosphate-sugar epimerase
MSERFTTNEQKIVMVTGGAGYVGSILLRKLLLNGYRVVCVDNLRYGGASLIDIWANPDFVFEKVDITNRNAMDGVFGRHKFDGVVHLAAIVGDPACKLEPDLARKTNLEAPAYILDRAIQSNVKRFVFASTCSNYGRMKNPHEYVDENSPLAPVSLYAELKVEFEKILLDQVQKDQDICPTILRFSTVYGISPRMRFDLTVNEFAKEIALGKQLRVFGEQFWRPYCHVQDFSKAILAVLEADKQKVAFNVFNVGDISQNYTKKMLVEELLKQVPDAQVEYTHKENDPRDYRVNFDKIRDVLGFHISRTVPEGIRDILTSIWSGIINNPQDQNYYNIPV